MPKKDKHLKEKVKKEKNNKTKVKEEIVNEEEKAKDFVKAYKRLFKYNRPYMIPLIVALVFAGITAVLTIIGPRYLEQMTNVIIEGFVTQINLSEIGRLGIILVILYSLSQILDYFNGLIWAIVANKSAKKQRSAIANKINKLPLSYFDKSSTGDILSRVTNDIDVIVNAMNEVGSTMFWSVAMFIGSLIMMFVTNWIMAIVAVVSVLLGFVIMGAIVSKSQKYFKNVQDQTGEINGHIEEMYSGQSIVNVYNAKEEANEKFDEINERLYTSTKKSQYYMGLMFALMNFIGNFSYVAVCVTGAILVFNGTIEFGVIVAFMLYIRFFTNPLATIAQGAGQLQATAAASERVFEFLDEKEMSKEDKLIKKLNKSKVKGDIEFKNVKFGYKKNKIIIKDFSAKAKAGQKIAIVGPTGAGKTTIVNLLMKFYELNSGDILIDGVSTKELRRDNIHDLFVMVLQDTWTFEASIKDNIRYNQKDISDEQIVEVCKVVGLNHFIKTLPQGYDTVLGDVDSLSAGQKQLLTIARAMLKDAPFLILDEATSSVDTRTEILVQEAMDKLTQGKTSFIIAHRLSTIKNADIILVMREGNIVEQGSHDELLKQNGFYAELYNSQFDMADDE